MRGQTLWFSGSLCFISSSMSGVAVFILVTPASSTDAPASKEREREREQETYTQIQRGRGSKKDPHPEGIELTAKHLHGYRAYLFVTD